MTEKCPTQGSLKKNLVVSWGSIPEWGCVFPPLTAVCMNIFRNIFLDKVVREEIPPQNDRQFLKVSMEPHPSAVYLKSSMNQGFD